MRRQLIVVAVALCLSAAMADNMQDSADKDRLAKAVEYFQSSKYHEALLLFRKLDSNYRLNPRFQAYMAVCCFYDRDYNEAARIFNNVLIDLQAFAPHELSVYYYCAAESNYQLKRYAESIPLFEKHSLVCYDNERGDALFRIGMCYAFLGNVDNAQEYLSQSLAYFRKYNDRYKLYDVEREIKNLYSK